MGLADRAKTGAQAAPAQFRRQRRCLGGPGRIEVDLLVAAGGVQGGPSAQRRGADEGLGQFGIEPTNAAMVEDMARNLAPAKQLGRTTVWVDNGSERGDHGYDEANIDFRITDVGEWLESILGDDR